MMGLHRLIGMRIGVPDPSGLASFYGEMGLTDDGSAGFAGTDGGTQVVVEEYDFRRLLEVRIAADDETTIVATSRRLTERGLTPSVDDTSLTVTGHAARDWMLQAQAFAGGATTGPAPRSADDEGGN